MDREPTKSLSAMTDLHRASPELERLGTADRLKIIADMAPCWETWHLPDGRIGYMSPFCLEVTGYSAEEFIAEPDLYRRIIFPQDRYKVKALHMASNADRGPMEYRIVCKDGTVKWVQHICREILDERGDSLGWRSSNHDITHLRAKEENYRRYELLACRTRDIILFVGRTEGRIIDANDSAIAAYGYTKEQLLELSIFDLRADPSQEIVTNQMEEAYENGLLFETYHKDKDGRVFPVEINSSGAHHMGMDILVSVIRDISIRKEAQMELERSREQLRIAVDKFEKLFYRSPSMHSLVRVDDVVFVEVNPAFERYTGYDRSELIGKNAYELGLVRHEGAMKNIDQRVKNREPVDNFEQKVYTKDGKVLTCLFSLEYIEIEHQWYVLAAAIDISYKAQELDARNAELLQRSQQLTRLASQLSLSEQRERERIARILHDHVQQLMAASQLNISILGGQITDNPELRALVDESYDLIRQAIEESRSLSQELAPPGLRERGLFGALQWLRGWMRNKHKLRVELSAQEQVDTDGEDTQIFILEIVRELLFNVVKHAGVKQAEVEVAQHGPNDLRIVVSDQGKGFDPSGLWQHDQDEAGFGLMHIRERVNFLGGSFEIDSIPGQGSRFTVILPVKLIHAAKEGAIKPLECQKEEPASQHIDGKIRLLLAEDFPATRLGLSRMIEREKDIEIIERAWDGEQAVLLARALRPDVILMDYSMPKMNGAQAARIIHHEMPEIRIIAFSMYDDDHIVRAMKEAGAAAYLSKAGPWEKLITTIRAAR